MSQINIAAARTARADSLLSRQLYSTGGMMVYKAYLSATFLIVSCIIICPVAWAQSLSPVKNLEVVDAQGRKVGDVIDIENQLPVVMHRLNDQFIAITVAENALGGNTILLYSSNDCSGPPFLIDNSTQFFGVLTTLFPSVAVAPPGSTVYLPRPGVSSQMITLGSVQGEVGDCQALPEPQSGLAFEAQPVLNLDNFFTPPFRLQEAAGAP